MHVAQFHAHSQLEQTHWWFTARRQLLLALTEELLQAETRALVIEVGCGTGANCAALARKYECVGIDPSAEAIRLAQERFPDATFRCGIAPDDLGQLAERADLFLLADVLEHVADDGDLFASLVAVARPGAHFIITVPADMALWSPHDESHGHYRRYQRAELELLWSDLPLTPLLVSHFNTRLYPLVRLARMVAQFTGRSLGRANTDLSQPPAFINGALRRVFSGETRRLVAALRGHRRAGYRYGVSLLAVLRREGDGNVPTKNAACLLPAAQRV